MAEPSSLRLRVFLRESMRHGRLPLFEYLVRLAREQGLAGATAFRGIEGFGAHHHIHTTRLVDTSDDLPIVVEFIDRADRINTFSDLLAAVVPHGLITVAPVDIRYRGGQEPE